MSRTSIARARLTVAANVRTAEIVEEIVADAAADRAAADDEDAVAVMAAVDATAAVMAGTGVAADGINFFSADARGFGNGELRLRLRLFFSGFKVSKFQGSKDDFGTSHFFSADAGGFRGFSWRAATFVEQSGLSGRSFLTGH